MLEADEPGPPTKGFVDDDALVGPLMNVISSILNSSRPRQRPLTFGGNIRTSSPLFAAVRWMVDIFRHIKEHFVYVLEKRIKIWE